MCLLSEDDGKCALAIAKAAVFEAVTRKKSDYPVFSPVFSEKRGVFVTLNEDGNLRGCIGFPYPVMELGTAIKDAAQQAACEDPRFYPVRESELPHLSLEVTVLTMPEVLLCPAEKRPENIQVGRHGLIAQYGGYSGLLLPQVATEWGWDSTEFLSQTCVKAGLSPETWKKDECTILTFEGQIFEENQPWQ